MGEEPRDRPEENWVHGGRDGEVMVEYYIDEDKLIHTRRWSEGKLASAPFGIDDVYPRAVEELKKRWNEMGYKGEFPSQEHVTAKEIRLIVVSETQYYWVCDIVWIRFGIRKLEIPILADGEVPECRIKAVKKPTTAE
jgi:hypothetical protein